MSGKALWMRWDKDINIPNPELALKGTARSTGSICSESARQNKDSRNGKSTGRLSAQPLSPAPLPIPLAPLSLLTGLETPDYKQSLCRSSPEFRTALFRRGGSGRVSSSPEEEAVERLASLRWESALRLREEVASTKLSTLANSGAQSPH